MERSILTLQSLPKDKQTCKWSHPHPFSSEVLFTLKFQLIQSPRFMKEKYFSTFMKRSILTLQSLRSHGVPRGSIRHNRSIIPRTKVAHHAAHLCRRHRLPRRRGNFDLLWRVTRRVTIHRRVRRHRKVLRHGKLSRVVRLHVRGVRHTDKKHCPVNLVNDLSSSSRLLISSLTAWCKACL